MGFEIRTGIKKKKKISETDSKTLLKLYETGHLSCSDFSKIVSHNNKLTELGIKFWNQRILEWDKQQRPEHADLATDSDY